VTAGPLLVVGGGGERVEIGVSPRIGITHCADWPLRFFIKGSKFVSAQ
jgi:3-methyladenine DNA glycosylase Mpg